MSKPKQRKAKATRKPFRAVSNHMIGAGAEWLMDIEPELAVILRGARATLHILRPNKDDCAVLLIRTPDTEFQLFAWGNQPQTWRLGRIDKDGLLYRLQAWLDKWNAELRIERSRGRDRLNFHRPAHWGVRTAATMVEARGPGLWTMAFRE